MLDRRFADLQDQRRQLDQARDAANKERETLLAEQKKLDEAKKAQDKAANDQGFEETLERYNAMPPKQVKGIFMTMTDDTMIQYLRAMEPPKVAKIFKEFKTPDELDRVAKVMKKMGQPEASVKE